MAAGIGIVRNPTWRTSTIFLAAFITSLSSPFVASQDGLCFLKDGRPSESFAVSEQLPIGSIVGTLGIIGDPGSNGNIILELEQGKFQDFLEIATGTKNLILKHQLDKENVDGPNHLNVTVRCDKKTSNDLSIPIPVKIFVDDANDNSPQFIGAPYKIQISEVSSVGMKVSQGLIKATDRDQPGPFSTVQYSVEPGPFAKYLAFEIPLEGTLILKSELDFEKLPNFTVTIRAQDQGNPALSSNTTLTVQVTDADDQNPKFASESYFAVMPNNANPGDILRVDPQRIHAQDQDTLIKAPIKYSINAATADSKYFQIDEQTGELSLTNPVPDEVMFPITIVVKATQENNLDRYALTPVTVTRANTPTRLKFLRPFYKLSILENVPIGQPILRLHTNRHFDDQLFFTLENTFDGLFGINNSGELVPLKQLDYEQEDSYSLRATVASGNMVDTVIVNISVQNVNEHDPAFTYDQYHFHVSDSDLKSNNSVGRVVVSDGDRNDLVHLRLTGTLASAFAIDDHGYITIRNVSKLNSTMAHLVVIARDDGKPPRQTSVPLVISVPEKAIMSDTFLSASSTFFLMILFGVLLAILFVIIIVLTGYLVKYKHRRDKVGQYPTYPNHQPISKMASYVTGGIPHQKLNADASPRQDLANRIGVANPIFQDGPPTSLPNTNSSMQLECSCATLDICGLSFLTYTTLCRYVPFMLCTV